MNIHVSAQRQEAHGLKGGVAWAGSPLSHWKVFLDLLALRHLDCAPSFPSPFLPSPLPSPLLTCSFGAAAPQYVILFRLLQCLLVRLPVKRNSDVYYYGPIYKFEVKELKDLQE